MLVLDGKCAVEHSENQHKESCTEEHSFQLILAVLRTKSRTGLVKVAWHGSPVHFSSPQAKLCSASGLHITGKATTTFPHWSTRVGNLMVSRSQCTWTSNFQELLERASPAKSSATSHTAQSGQLDVSTELFQKVR